MLRRMIALLAVLALVAAACGDDDEPVLTAGPAATAAPAVTATPVASACEGATLSFIGLAGEEGDAELAAWRAERNMTLEISDTADFAAMISAVQVGQEYDLMTIPFFQSQRMISSGILQPIDTSRLTNWGDVFPGLRDNPGIRDSSGQVFGVPLVWGDGPFIYHPERVENPPVSFLELADPAWKGRFVMFDDPSGPFYLIALALGFSDAPLLTPEQLTAVAEQAKPIVANVSAFANGFQDATDRMVAGDVDLSWPGWEAQLNWSEEKGVTLEDSLFEESAAGWWDGLAIPTSSKNIDCVYEYLDAIISPELNADVANNLASGASNSKAESLVSGVAAMYDYSLVKTLTDRTEIAFKSSSPPEEPPEGIASLQDWIDVWEEVKAGL